MKYDFASEPKFYDTGDVVFLEYEPSDNFYMVLSGSVKIIKITKNNESLIDKDYPGDFFGEMSLLDNTERIGSVIAAEPTVLLEFKKENFVSILNSNQTVAIKTLSMFVDRVSSARRKLLILQFQEPEIRIYDCILSTAETQNISRASYFEHQDLQISVEDIASYCALDIRSTEKVIANLVRADKIQILSPTTILAKSLSDFQRIIDSKRKIK